MKLFKDDNTAGAEFSPCRKYRYSLWRIWNKTRPIIVFILLNPSTADENTNDPTIRRCMNYAESWGYGGLYILNIFALRSTDPKKLYQAEDPIGSENDFYIKKYCDIHEMVIIGWGNHGQHKNRSSDVLKYLKKPHCLSITNIGEPGHPLYLKSDLKPQFYFWHDEVENENRSG